MAIEPKSWGEMSADALREAGVLVLVFGLLDKYMFGAGPFGGLDGRSRCRGPAKLRARKHARTDQEDVMGPYNAILGVLAFVLVVGAIGAIDVIRGRRQRRHDSSAPAQ
jgi:hypothetical protein